jgi:aspartyl-tRNA(Asn)/glutamyl-tRNA(Gln) amidotransferase subunit B
MPELPAAKKQRYIGEFSLSDYDASILTNSKFTAEYFEQCVLQYPNPKAVCNYIMVDLLKMLNESGMEASQIPVPAGDLCGLLKLLEDGVVNSSVGKQVFEEMFKTGKPPEQIVEEKGLKQIDDTDAIHELVLRIIRDNPKPAADYRSGNAKAMTFFVGQVMKATNGKANPKTVNELVKKELDG